MVTARDGVGAAAREKKITTSDCFRLFEVFSGGGINAPVGVANATFW